LVSALSGASTLFSRGSFDFSATARFPCRGVFFSYFRDELFEILVFSQSHLNFWYLLTPNCLRFSRPLCELHLSCRRFFCLPLLLPIVPCTCLRVCDAVDDVSTHSRAVVPLQYLLAPRTFATRSFLRAYEPPRFFSPPHEAFVEYFVFRFRLFALFICPLGRRERCFSSS